MTASTDVAQIKLNNGVLMPQVGLGTWQAEEGNEATDAVRSGLDIGYRLLDTAAIYGNEASVGRAVRDSGLAREDIFVTTKLWNDSHDYDHALRAYDDSLKRLGLDYVDLYLIHWPVPAQNKFVQAWRALEKLYDSGQVRAIGVSNFSPAQLTELLADAHVVPAVDQIELHPRKQQQATRDFCARHDIRVESYSPLQRAGELLQDPTLRAIADKHGKTPAQIVLRWHIQNGFVVIPKSVNPGRQRSNFELFDFGLDDRDMEWIDALDHSARSPGEA